MVKLPFKDRGVSETTTEGDVVITSTKADETSTEVSEGC